MSTFNGSLTPGEKIDSGPLINETPHASVNGVKHQSNKSEVNHKSLNQSSNHHKSNKESSNKHHSSSEGKHHKHHKSSKDKSKEKHSGGSEKHNSSSSGVEKPGYDKHINKSGDKTKEHRKDDSKHSKSHKHSGEVKHSGDGKHNSSEHKSKHSEKHGSGDNKHNISKQSSGDKPISKLNSSSSSEKHSSPEKHGDKHKVKVKKEEIKQEKKEGVNIKQETPELQSEEDIPLSARADKEVKKEQVKRELDESDDEPLASRAQKKLKKTKLEKKRKADDDEDFRLSSAKKKKKNEENQQRKVQPVKKSPVSSPVKGSPTKSPRKKAKEEEVEVWKWWEEEKLGDGVKWRTLSHKGPIFAPPYEHLPKSVKFFYDGKIMELSPEAEEVAGFYGRMLDHDYVTKEAFNKNFFKDWKKVMTPEERSIITDLRKCNFSQLNDYYKMKSEERKAMSKEEKQAIKKANDAQLEEYGFCIIDGHKQRIGNFKIEPPGLFRGRGEHPKMGMLKKRIMPENVIINIGKDAEKPVPPPGHKWKEVRCDNTVTWLACWTENILNQNKYIMLNPSSKLKGEKDFKKYEMARKLKSHADRIRKGYQDDWRNKEMRVRQRAVALYFIDKLALRAGNEKEEGETADTVGCCSLRVEHITLDERKDGKDHVVTFDFLGKDSIRYINSVPVEKRVFKNLKLFMENKQPGDDLFDRLNTSILNKYLNDLMDGLTAKVFRTYNASKTLQEQLDQLTQEDMSLPEKLLAYNRANRAVAILCNHQRSIPKTFDKQMENMQKKIEDKEEQISECKKEMKELKNRGDKAALEKKKKRLNSLMEQLKKLEVTQTDKEENKQIALGTSKLNYLDPRISVAWCKKWEIPIEKIYNKTQRDKFRWAIEMATPDYTF